MQTERSLLTSLPRDCQCVLLVLHYADSGCELPILEKLIGAAPGTLAESLTHLKELGLIQEIQAQCFRSNVALAEVELAALSQHNASALHNPFLHMLHLRYEHEYATLLQQSHAILESVMAKQDWLAAKRFFDCIHTLFISCKIPVNEVALCQEFIKVSYTFLLWYVRFPWLNRKTLLWYFKVRGLAFAIDDKYQLALMDISIGYLEINNFSLHRKFSYSKFLKKGIEYSLSMGNDELIAITFPYSSFMYCTNGEFTKAINCVYSQFYKEKNVNAITYHRTLFANGLLSAVHNGEYDIAIDIGRTGQRVAQELGHTQDALLFQAYIAYVYLLKGEESLCLDIVHAILIKGDDIVLTYPGLWAARVLAYSHYLHGDIQASYACYTSRLRTASLAGIIHTGYLSAHFMLEMLVQFHIAGFQNPIQRSIYGEIEKSIYSSNLPLKVTALRLKAVLYIHERGWDNVEAAQCLQSALSLAHALSAPIEQVKILFCQTRILLNTGRTTAAQACFQEALAIHSRYQSPPVPDDLQALLATALARPEETLSSQGPKTSQGAEAESFFSFQSEAMLDVQRKIEILAAKNTPVLILGESGVGKERVARQLHTLSGRKGAFLPVNLASVTEELFESEFYGHEKGSFTGAHCQKAGLFEIADQGTLFLDEVGDIPPRIQVKLLRVLQEKQFMRVGGTKQLCSDFRLVSATNKDLQQEVRVGNFREDLFYRVSVVSLTIPPLCKRGNEVLLLSHFFLNYFLKSHNLPFRNFNAADLAFIMSYSWPGNIRELKNYIERFVLLADTERPDNNPVMIFSDTDKPLLPSPHQVSENVLHNTIYGENTNIFALLPPENFSSGLPCMEQMKSHYFEFVYQQTGGVVSGPGGILDILKISKATAYQWIHKLKLSEKFARRMVRCDG